MITWRTDGARVILRSAEKNKEFTLSDSSSEIFLKQFDRMEDAADKQDLLKRWFESMERCERP